MSKSQDVMLIRHPQTERNAQGCYIGRQDSPLTPTGEAQVRWLSRVVAAWEPEITFTSPLGRALNTARAVTPATVEVRLLDDLQEIDFGEAEGHTYDQLTELGIRLDYLSGGPVAPGGETGASFTQRVLRSAATVEESGRRALVVTHGGVLRRLLTNWLELPDECAWRFAVPNASIAIIRIAEGTGVLEGLTPPPEDPAHHPQRRRRPWHL